MNFSWKILLILGLLPLVGAVGLIWRKSCRKGKLGKQKQRGAHFVMGALLYTFPNLSLQQALKHRDIQGIVSNSWNMRVDGLHSCN